MISGPVRFTGLHVAFQKDGAWWAACQNDGAERLNLSDLVQEENGLLAYCPKVDGIRQEVWRADEGIFCPQCLKTVRDGKLGPYREDQDGG